MNILKPLPMEKRLLMIAFHYPPFAQSSGVLRTTRFKKYLGALNWQVEVLTADQRAYESPGAGAQEGEDVTRAFALDTRRHLSIGGKYPEFLALPDRWVSWLPGAVVQGRKRIRALDIDVIWSTYPIATAHLIGYCLKRRTGKPWVADLRDPMIDAVHPVGRSKRWVFRKIEALVFKHADLICCTTGGAAALYRRRYPDYAAENILCIPNGYDEDDFSAVDRQASGSPAAGQKLTLLHSGTLYPVERDPAPFFQALLELKRTGKVAADNFQVVLRATGHDGFIAALLDDLGLHDIVRLEAGLDYQSALGEMVRADGLLVLQAANCNAQIPAKVYEYLRVGNPLFAMTDAAGDTAALLNEAGVKSVVPIDDSGAIADGLLRFIEAIRLDQVAGPDPAYVKTLSRERSAQMLAGALDRLITSKT